MSQAPANVSGITRNGVTYVPLRSVVEQLGGNISWDNEAKTATFNVRNVTGQIWEGNSTFQANGQTHTLDGPPFIENGTLYVPVDTLHDIGLTTG
jgi:hypothetical protein